MRHPITSLGQSEANNPPVTGPSGQFSLGNRAYIGRDYYVYSAPIANLPAGGSASFSISFQADADFVWQKASFQAYATTPVALTANTRIIPAVTVQMTDTGSGRDLFDQPIPIPMIFGTGELPFIIPTPRLFAARSTLKIDFTNLDASTAVYISLAFIGYKAYRAGDY